MNAASIPMNHQRLGRMNAAYGAFVLISVVVFWKACTSLVSYSLDNESSSHIILIPFVSAFLLVIERRRIFTAVRSSFVIGPGVVLAGILLYLVVARHASAWPGNSPLSATALAIILVWLGGFMCCYGLRAARAAAFPLLFLLLMIPVPDKALDWMIHLLQQGSTDVTCFFFNLFGVPYLRNGFVLSLPTVNIEVAKECSGIRSSIALFITCLLAAHFYLRTWWKILLFVVLVFPLVVVKNGIRIATLTLLSIYVDPGFLSGRLHHEGGFVFFLLTLLLLFPVFLLLEKSEHRRSSTRTAAT